MIDRTKYEGHTPGPWLAREYWSGSWFLMDDNGGREFARFESGPNAALAADAPLLLSELDRVTAERDRLAEALRRIAESEPRPRRSGHYDADVHQGMQRTARAALEPKP